MHFYRNKYVGGWVHFKRMKGLVPKEIVLEESAEFWEALTKGQCSIVKKLTLINSFDTNIFRFKLQQIVLGLDERKKLFGTVHLIGLMN